MRDYNEARVLADEGVTAIAGSAGGRTRWVSFEHRDGGAVAARIFKTDVVTFYPDRFEVRTGGYITPSTFDGIAAALNVSRGVVGTVKKVPYLMGVELSADPNAFTVHAYHDAQPYTG